MVQILSKRFWQIMSFTLDKKQFFFQLLISGKFIKLKTESKLEKY